MAEIDINLQRIEYMMKLFGFNRGSLLDEINHRSKNKTDVREQDIFTGTIKESYLKKVDAIFQKGLSFYTDPEELATDSNSSIFFRKDSFSTELNLGAREIVHKVECHAQFLSALCKLSEYRLERKLKRYRVQDNAIEVGYQIRQKLYPKNSYDEDRDFLKAFIGACAEKNILVLEFVETWNKKNKSNVNGFFIAPNIISIKRNQQALKREIFTLAHELGHYLLDKEELDDIKFDVGDGTSNVERWCNAFAFAFLMGAEGSEGIRVIAQSGKLTLYNEEIVDISRKYHINRLALFTFLSVNKYIPWNKYQQLKTQLQQEYKRRQEEKEEEKERQKLAGKMTQGRAPKAMFSPLERSIYASAFHSGIIEEYDVLSRFRGQKLEQIIYE